MRFYGTGRVRGAMRRLLVVSVLALTVAGCLSVSGLPVDDLARDDLGQAEGVAPDAMSDGVVARDDVSPGGDEGTIGPDDTDVPADEGTVGPDDAQVPADEGTVGPDDAQVPADEGTVGPDDTDVPADEGTVGPDDTQVPADEGTVGPDDTQVPADEGTVGPDYSDVPADEGTVGPDYPEVPADEGTVGPDYPEIPANEGTVGPDYPEIPAGEGTVGPDYPEIPANEGTVGPDYPEIPANEGTVGPDASGGPLEIRFMAANLTSGSGQSYDPGHGIRLMAGCKADILMVQEFNYGSNSAADYREMTDEICGTGCYYTVGDGQIPNGVVSRWPIIESGAWDDPTISNRDLDWARIDLPGTRDIVAVSVHLHTSPSSDQVTAAQVVARRVAEYRAAHPGCCYYVVGGDFNGTSSVSDRGFGAYDGQDVFYVSSPHPVGEDGKPGTNASRSSQYDFVLLDTDLHAYQVPLVLPAADDSAPLTYPNGLVFDTRNFSQDELDRYFAPAKTGDSSASSMQHMGIVKPVRLP